jgi:hypothetical protein
VMTKTSVVKTNDPLAPGYLCDKVTGLRECLRIVAIKGVMVLAEHPEQSWTIQIFSLPPLNHTSPDFSKSEKT